MHKRSLYFWQGGVGRAKLRKIFLCKKNDKNILWNKKHFFTNCRNYCKLILSSICKQTHEIIIYSICQWVIANNFTICYHKSKLPSVFHASVHNEFHHTIVNPAVDPWGDSLTVHNRTDVWKTELETKILQDPTVE